MIPGVAGTAGSHIFMVPNEDMERAMFQSIEALRKEQAKWRTELYLKANSISSI